MCRAGFGRSNTFEWELADFGDVIQTIYNPIIKLLREIEKPIVAAVNGAAAGAGANIALAADVVVASSEAVFVQAFSQTLTEQLANEKKYQALAGKTEDFIEGVSAFQQKKKPNFKGE